MKDSYPHIGIVRLCRSFGATRQAYYQHFWRAETCSVEHDLVLSRIAAIRKDHRRLGTRKLMDKLQPFLLEHAIKMGRDALFDLLADHGLLVKRLRKYVHTTRSNHWMRKWPNLIRELKLTAPGQLWVSDITYFKTARHGHVYISLITEAYSHRIMGYCLATDLEAVNNVEALRMAIAYVGKAPKGLIHHSDRGSQYCSHEYVQLLHANGIGISMTENGDPLENAVAERINGILKQEYLDVRTIDTVDQAKAALARAVLLYNSDRPHASISNCTPDVVHHTNPTVKRLWKNYYPKRSPANPVQNDPPTVNLSSDTNTNL